MLIDEVTIKVRAGQGGDGSAHFRREKFVPKGGPDGGDGGDGGDVWVQVDRAVHGLSVFAHQKQFAAGNGEPGRGKKQHGADGADLILIVPPGTVVWEGKKRLADLILPAERYLVARAGYGGRGNVHFATSTHQTPTEFEAGTAGQEKIIRLELKLLADVGLIGLPNAGKSSLLARITAAKPKIAGYAFTTLEPNLGVLDPVKLGSTLRSSLLSLHLVLADIPGLIAGAHQGKGLGDQFLRHIERTQVLVHLIDATHPDPLAAYAEIRHELAAWNPALPDKTEIVVLSKIDLLDERAQRRLLTKVKKLKPISISSATGRGLADLVQAIRLSIPSRSDPTLE